MKVKKLKGFRDVLPEESPAWIKLEQVVSQIFTRYGFAQVRLPLLEQSTLFSRTIGEATDIVEKEMYTFVDTGGEQITLRPEGTASAVRAFVENGFDRSNPKARWYYIGSMFRRERPQKGRFRQFNQVGVECFGWKAPGADADVITMLWDLFTALGLSGRVSLEINSLGCADDRKAYSDKLAKYGAERIDKLCDNCKKRLGKNPLRILDCKSPSCQEATADAPSPVDSLCDECTEHFSTVRILLDDQGVPFKVNPRMVRGLDYYSRTTFELLTTELGAQNAVAAGGRYDALVEQLGGRPTPGLGFAIGLERLILLLGDEWASADTPDVYMVYTGAEAFLMAMRLRRLLMLRSTTTTIDFEQRSMKAQFKSANTCGAKWAMVIGESEVEKGEVTVKNLAESQQQTLSINNAIELVSTKIIASDEE